MSLEVYPSDFSTRYEISHAISITESVYYNATGDLQLTVPASDYNIKALKIGNLIYDTDRRACFIVVGVKADTSSNYIICYGKTTDYILNRRVIYPHIEINNVESGVYKIVSDNLRGLTRINLAPAKGFPNIKEKDDEGNPYKTDGGEILDEIHDLLDGAELGCRMVWDGDAEEHTFEVYKGRDLSENDVPPFSEEQGTAKELVLNDDEKHFKNYAYVEGYYAGDNGSFVVQVGSASGDDRREMWFRSTVRQENGESKSSAQSRAKKEGQEELKHYFRRQTFQISIDPAELGSIYQLGDVIACSSARFGAEFNARITGIKYTLGSLGEKTQVVLGDPIITALGAIKL